MTSLCIAWQLPPQHPELQMVLPVRGSSQTGWEGGSVIYPIAKRIKGFPCIDIIPTAALKNASELHFLTLKFQIQAPNNHFITQTRFLER